MHSTPLQFRETIVRYDRAAVSRLLIELGHGDYEIVDPRVARMMHTKSDQFEATNGWFLTAQSESKRWLVDMITSDESLLGADLPGFCRWVEAFNPTNCNDWLSLPLLYRRHISTGLIFSLAVNAPTTFIGRIVEPTRGWIHWTSQLEELIYLALGNQAEVLKVRELSRGYRRQNTDVLDELDTLFIDGQSLRTILYHHTDGLKYFFGGPNHFISGFLSEHFGRYRISI